MNIGCRKIKSALPPQNLANRLKKNCEHEFYFLQLAGIYSPYIFVQIYRQHLRRQHQRSNFLLLFALLFSKIQSVVIVNVHFDYQRDEFDTLIHIIAH